MLGFIGGTGFYRLVGQGWQSRQVTTRWGDVMVQVGRHEGQELVFLPRHGAGHQTPPQGINYRANIAALQALGVTAVVASNAVGTLSPDIPPGSLCLLTDFIDATWGRAGTFFEQDVVHLDSTTPYCPRLRASLTACAAAQRIALLPCATYVCTNGPRFETPAEIRMYRAWGADLVGMTNVPEVVLAREAELCYATVAIATNNAAGLAGYALTHTEVEEIMATRVPDLATLCLAWAAGGPTADCACRHALDESRRRRQDAAFGIPR
ncbi:MAG: MTAP family purine nucleoside phosphorylase [Fimbriimonadaceae bacterium]|nr:MTAP family purine nucleoside phosphorylase [Fimbriimonadaceae bacterium]